jgi:hypothetical protein
MRRSHQLLTTQMQHDEEEDTKKMMKKKKIAPPTPAGARNKSIPCEEEEFILSTMATPTTDYTNKPPTAVKCTKIG